MLLHIKQIVYNAIIGFNPIFKFIVAFIKLLFNHSGWPSEQQNFIRVGM